MFTLPVPFTMMAVGSTHSGKSSFIVRMIKEQSDLFAKPFKQIYYFYNEWQPLFEQLRTNRIVHFKEGAPTAECLDEIPPDSLVVIDDMLTKLCDSKDLVELFTVKSHHRRISVVFVSQSFFYDTKQMRCVTRNCHFIVLFKSPRMASVVEQLSRQIWPTKKNFLTDAYAKATKEPYTYLFLDLHPSSPENLRVLSKIMPSDEHAHVFL